MFAIFETGGKQYRAEVGKVLEVEKLSAAVGEAVTFDRIFLLDDDGKTQIGEPFVSGATVTAKITAQERYHKIRVVKFTAKKRTKTIRGHRQHFSTIEISSINAA